MPKMLSDGNRKLTWVPEGGIADVAAPTTSELTASGVLDASCLVTLADYALGPTEDAEISDPPLCATGNSTAPGRTSYEAAMNFFRWTDTAEDEGWSTFTSKNIAGFLVQRIGPSYDQPYAADDEVEVYGVITGTPRNLNPDGDGGYQKFRQVYHVQGEQVELRATVASSS